MVQISEKVEMEIIGFVGLGLLAGILINNYNVVLLALGILGTYLGNQQLNITSKPLEPVISPDFNKEPPVEPELPEQPLD